MTTLLFPILASLPVEISDGLADKLSTLAGYVLTAGAGGLLVFIALRSVSAVSGGIRSMITPDEQGYRMEGGRFYDPDGDEISENEAVAVGLIAPPQPGEGFHWSADGMVHVPDGMTDDEYSARLAADYVGNDGEMDEAEWERRNAEHNSFLQSLSGASSDLRDDARNEEWESIRDEIKERYEGSSDASYGAAADRAYQQFQSGEIRDYADYIDLYGTREEVANMEREDENDAEKALREAADSGSSIDWSPMSRRA